MYEIGELCIYDLEPRMSYFMFSFHSPLIPDLHLAKLLYKLMMFVHISNNTTYSFVKRSYTIRLNGPNICIVLRFQIRFSISNLFKLMEKWI